MKLEAIKTNSNLAYRDDHSPFAVCSVVEWHICCRYPPPPVVKDAVGMRATSDA